MSRGHTADGGLSRPVAAVDGRAVATWRLVGGRVAPEPSAESDPAPLADEVRDVERFLDAARTMSA